MDNLELNFRMIGIVNKIEKFCPSIENEVDEFGDNCIGDACQHRKRCNKLVKQWDQYQEAIIK